MIAMLSPFAVAVSLELASARQHHNPQNSLHEACAVIFEGMCELWEIARATEQHRDSSYTLRELVQIGAMAQRVAEDLGLIGSLIPTEPNGGAV